MSSTIAQEQAADTSPPRKGAVLALTIDSTARAYDLTALDLGGFAFSVGRRNEVFLTLFADGGDVYYYFASDNTATVDDTAVVAAGGTLAYANGYAMKLPSGAAHSVRINRATDKYLQVKTSAGSATLRLFASSPAGA
jgi:hypothetical protein